MAVPSNAQVRRGFPLKSGVMLGISPSSDPTFDVEIARSSTGAYTTIARLTGKGEGVPVSFTDILPVDGQYRSYKARAVKDGWLAGDYTDVLEVKPVILPEIAPNITPLTGKGIGAALFISTATPPQYGQADNQAYYDVPLTVYPFEFISTANAVTYSANAQYLYPQTTAARIFRWKSIIPNGSSVGTVSLLYRRPSGGNLRFLISTLSASTTTTTVIDYTATGSGAGIFTKSFTSGFGVGNVNYYAQVEITSTSGSTASVMLRGVSFEYKKPNAGVGV